MKILNKLFGEGANNLLKSAGNIVDELVTTKEEKQEAKRKMKELILSHQAEMEKNISSRWQADLQYGNWLTRSVRPLVLIFLIVCTMLLVFIDSGSIEFKVEEKWTELLQLVLITTVGAYFGGRSFEKVKKK
tara:strand:+ start:4767 stop:5162 length:396 start_codon:yes stop_codon:yes gene_type:complete